MALNSSSDSELSQSVGDNLSETDDVEMETPQEQEAGDDDGDNSRSVETPQIPRSVHLLTTVRESPDEFRPKVSSKRTKIVKSPVKSPEKDDDVS